MSDLCILNFKTEKRSLSEDNKNDARLISKIKDQKKQQEIIKEIITKNIKTNLTFISKNYISFIPRRCHSQINIRNFPDLDECDNEKMKFDEWINYNKESHQKIEGEILKLLIDIFDKRYKLYPNNMCGLSLFALQCKKNIEIVCPNFYELSLYILYVLHKQFTPFFKYINEKNNINKQIKTEKYENIKEILYYIGKDIKKIFNEAIDNIGNFNFSSILIIMFEEYLIKNNQIEEKKIKNIPLNEVKEKFEKVLGGIQNLYFLKDYEKVLDKKVNLTNNDNNEDEKINVNNIDKNNDKNNKENIEINENENNNNNNKGTILNLNIDDLVNYINDSKTKKNKKKKKKKKKGKKVLKVEKTQENNTNNYIEEDIVILNYKKSLEEFTQSVLYTQKIKPKYSEKFLKQLEAKIE